MRLINVETFKLEEFLDDTVPPYAILSHTWGNDNDEVSFRNFEEGNIEKAGVRPIKLEGCCRQAKKDNLRYAWIDTCCIDKTNSVELGEAINSMFRWYMDASICYAYLSDVPANDNPQDSEYKFFLSRWFERWWTLQELLAPRKLCFYSSQWCFLGIKSEMSVMIEKITGIPCPFLLGNAELRDASVAQRMSWAAKRVTKRKEDAAYCLLGIFGVMIPMIYGEGGQAFSRLQQEIMREVRDDSILAWGHHFTNSAPSNSTDVISGGVLAAAPSDFKNCGHIVSREQYATTRSSFDIFGGSLRIRVPIFTTSAGETFGLLGCGPGYKAKQVVGIPLNIAMSSGPSDDYIRPQGRYSVLFPKATSEVSTKLIHIRKQPQSRALEAVNRPNWPYVEESVRTKLEQIGAKRRARWQKDNATITVETRRFGFIEPSTSTRYCIGTKVAPVHPNPNTRVCEKKGGSIVILHSGMVIVKKPGHWPELCCNSTRACNHEVGGLKESLEWERKHTALDSDWIDFALDQINEACADFVKNSSSWMLSRGVWPLIEDLETQLQEDRGDAISTIRGIYHWN